MHASSVYVSLEDEIDIGVATKREQSLRYVVRCNAVESNEEGRGKREEGRGKREEGRRGYFNSGCTVCSLCSRIGQVADSKIPSD